MIVTAQKLLLALYLVAGVVAISTLLYSYGGWRGNFDSALVSYDTTIAGDVLFNRWHLPPDWWSNESLGIKFVRSFVLANLPAFYLAALLFKILVQWVPPFNSSPFPFGVSEESYFCILFSISGAVQWFLTGTLIDKWRKEARRLRERPHRILLAALPLIFLSAVSFGHCFHLGAVNDQRLDEHKKDLCGVFFNLVVFAWALVVAAACLFGIQPKPREPNPTADWGKGKGASPLPCSKFSD